MIQAVKKHAGVCSMVMRLFQLKGSIFPPALAIALPAGLISAVLKFGQRRHWFSVVDNLNVLSSPAAWTAFSALLGFLVVFRTSQAYTRFWAGCSATHAMRLDWFNACTMLMAYARVSKAPEVQVNDFMGRLVRLISIMHAAALAELEEINVDTESVADLTALKHGVLDPRGLDEESRKTIGESSCKVELVFTWIQMLIVESVDRGVISPPPPVLSSVSNVFIKGMNSFGDALRISFVPFPFPYVQTCDMLLVLHWFMTPMVVLAWVEYYSWAGLLTFLQVFIVQALNLIAVEIENPFGVDANDLDSAGMQEEMNGYLVLFSKRGMRKIPHLTAEAISDYDLHLRELQQPLLAAFDTLDIELAESDRKGRDFSRARIREKQRRTRTVTKSVFMHRDTESRAHSLKRGGTRDQLDQGHNSDQFHQFDGPSAQDQHVEQPRLQAMPPPMPVVDLGRTSFPPPPPDRGTASSASNSQGRTAQQGGPDPEQPPCGTGSHHIDVEQPKFGSPNNGDAFVMCTPEEEDVVTMHQTTSMSPTGWASRATSPQDRSATPTSRTSSERWRLNSPRAQRRPERSGQTFSLGWDPPAPANVSPITSGFTGSDDHQGSPVDLAAAGVTWRR